MGDSRLQPLVLSEDERLVLQGWAKRRTTAQGLAKRARIVLACADGLNNTAVAARLDTDRGTVSRWRTTFLQRRLDGLSDEPRPGVPRTITDAQMEEVAVRTLEEAPDGATHWSKRELARRVGISPTSVLRIWRAFGLQPWRTETFNQVERWFAELGVPVRTVSPAANGGDLARASPVWVSPAPYGCGV
ncbi:helix-turn-helix domain-containing protein [Streptomyces rishiriensis]|uniref:helix-turn-helix domain-containing protein n=1 Tax=Streptomyces rishiriensis TaxID=68264 RepID=UPI001FE5841E|nr:helix-turn-helix domain-containing protein [Streptomyces rishiriensis]